MEGGRSTNASKMRKCWIVEDNESIKQMLAGIFETFYQVTTASDGVEALDIIQKDMPSIILSDVVMPRMSGTELCKQIKTDFNTCHIPVVLPTARTAVEHNIEGLKIGATIISPSRSIPLS